jgi:hypothetical protein
MHTTKYVDDVSTTKYVDDVSTKLREDVIIST